MFVRLCQPTDIASMQGRSCFIVECDIMSYMNCAYDVMQSHPSHTIDLNILINSHS